MLVAVGQRDGQGDRMAEKGKVCHNGTMTHHCSIIKYAQICGGQSSPAYTVEKMTATSTTSPKTESSIENEDKEIQNILDKKRKKRRKQSNSKDSKQSKLEGEKKCSKSDFQKFNHFLPLSGFKNKTNLKHLIISKP